MKTKLVAVLLMAWSAVPVPGEPLGTASTHALDATLGQTPAGMVSSRTYRVQGGFWPAVTDLTDLPVITQQPTGQSVAAGTEVTFNVQATGTSALSCQWRKDGTDLVGRTNSTLSLTKVQAADFGTFTVIVSNASGSVLSQPAVLAVFNPAAVRWVGMSGDWNNPTNWSTGVIPGPTDDVLIDRPGVSLTVTHSSGTHSVLNLQSQEAFVLSGGSLTVSNTIEVNGMFTLTGGTLVLATVLQATNGAGIKCTSSGGT